ncbi:MAG: sulfite exporter TauE/SafE family protein [Candidatus Acidiferrales bacterium]
MAQGTSLFLQLPPLGLGALLVYWREKRVDLWAGATCALGFLIGGYFGSQIAIGMESRNLMGAFGIFITAAAVLLWWKSRPKPAESSPTQDPMPDSTSGDSARSTAGRPVRLLLILIVATGVGVCAGLFGVGGGVLLVPLLVLLFAFDQHSAQGTSLIALVPPVGLLAFLNYAHAHEVNWTVGLLIMPGVFLGGFAGSRLAQKLSPRRMRRVFAGFLFLLGVWQIATAWLLR